MKHKIKEYFALFFTERQVIVSSEKDVKTITISRESQMFIAGCFMLIGMFLCAILVFGSKIYAKLDKKQRKIEQMSQDSQLARTEIIKMMEQMDKINAYFAASNKHVKDIDAEVREMPNTSDNETVHNEEEGGQNTQKRVQNKDTRQRRHAQEVETGGGSDAAGAGKDATEYDKYTGLSNVDLSQMLKTKVAKWHSMALRKYTHMQKILTSLGISNCGQKSWLSRALNATGDVIGDIASSVGLGAKQESGVLSKIYSKICNSGNLNPVNAKNIKEVIEDSAFIPSLVKLEQVINGIPIGNPMPGLTKIGSGFGYRIDPVHHKTAKHEGLDLVGHYGTPIRATAAGTVQRAGWFNGYGLCVDIMHLYGMVTRYAHLSSAKVRIGQRVSVGQIIGLEGSSGKSTGPHLHYEIRINSVAINPIGFVMKRR